MDLVEKTKNEGRGKPASSPAKHMRPTKRRVEFGGDEDHERKRKKRRRSSNISVLNPITESQKKSEDSGIKRPMKWRHSLGTPFSNKIRELTKFRKVQRSKEADEIQAAVVQEQPFLVSNPDPVTPVPIDVTDLRPMVLF